MIFCSPSNVNQDSGIVRKTGETVFFWQIAVLLPYSATSSLRPIWLWVKTNGIPFWLVGEFTTHFRTYFSGWIGMFTGGTIWLLTHGHICRQSATEVGVMHRHGGRRACLVCMFLSLPYVPWQLACSSGLPLTLTQDLSRTRPTIRGGSLQKWSESPLNGDTPLLINQGFMNPGSTL